MSSPQLNLNNQAMTYDGLRSLNKLHMRTTHATQFSSSKGSKKSESDKVLGKIVCGKGMNLIFLGAEVGPWSKTGGLGDVLGGLPPALAVSELISSVFNFSL